jgi:itaconate CoA-transferase
LQTYSSALIDEYNKKLMTPARAVECIKSGDTIMHGLAISEPPALFSAIADNAREGKLRDLKIYSLKPSRYAEKTILSPDLSDCIQSYSWFVSESDRARVKVVSAISYPTIFIKFPG